MRVTFRANVTPVGKQRARLTKRGKFFRAYTPEKTKQYERVIREAFLISCAHTDIPLVGPLILDIIAVFPRTKALLKQYKNGQYKHPEGRILHTVKPDEDNIRKAVADAIGEYIEGGDSRIVGGSTLKVYAAINENPSTIVRIYKADDYEATFKTLYGSSDQYFDTLG